jgi:hypothetical protein
MTEQMSVSPETAGAVRADVARDAEGRPDLAALAGEFRELSRTLSAVGPEEGVLGVLDRVCRSARRIVTGADMVSVTLQKADGSFTTPSETDSLASRIDEVQYRAGEGPCVEATATPGVGMTYSPDLAADSGWPRFAPEAARLGVGAVLSTGIFPEESPLSGALNYYSWRKHGLDEADRDVALVLAAHVATALRGTEALTQAELRAMQLEEALQSRDVIGQAKGILMERRGCTADEAFEVLRRTSQDLNTKLRDLAGTLAERRAEL